jgi:hypothetical protein
MVAYWSVYGDFSATLYIGRMEFRSIDIR